MAAYNQFMAALMIRKSFVPYCFQLNKICRKTSSFMNLSKDVKIYQNDTLSGKFMSFLGLVGLGQWCMSLYMSQTLFNHMPAFFSWIPSDKTTTNDVSNRLPLADFKYRVGFTCLIAFASTGVFATLVLYNLRSVSSITLLKGGKDVMIKTFTPVGSYYTIICELAHISALHPRTAIVSQIPLKLNGRRFHFLVDKSGSFFQPTLYDQTVVCEEIISEKPNQETLQGVVFFLVESWDVVKRTKNDWNFLSNVCLSSVCVLEAVKRLRCEKLFSQVLLLLPEQQKYVVVKELCKLLKTFPDNNLTLRSQFCQEVSTHYINNLMNLPMRPVMLQIAYSILQEILEHLFPETKCESVKNLLWMLCLILEKFDLSFEKTFFSLRLNKFNDSPVSNVSLLNLSEREQVKKLKQSCSSIGDFNDKKDELHLRLFEDESLLTVLLKIICNISKTLERSSKTIVFDETLSEKCFINTLVTLRYITQVSSVIKNPSSLHESFIYSSTNFFKVLSSIKFNNQIIKYVCVDASIEDLLQLRNSFIEDDHKSKLSSWLSLKDKQEKFAVAIHRVNQLYFGHEEVIDWLLQFDDLSAEDASVWVLTLWSYTLRFCSVGMLKRYMDILHDRIVNGKCDILTKSLQELSLKCIENLSITSCNKLLFQNLKHFNPGKSMLWPQYNGIPGIFEKRLNEALNKLTDSDEPNIQAFRNIAQLCLVSPFVVLEEVVNRCLRKDFKVSVLLKVIENMPGLLELYIVTDATCLPAVLHFSHISYVKLHEKYNPEKIVYQLLIGLINASTSVRLLEWIVSWFIYPSLHGEVTLYNQNFSLELLEASLMLTNIWHIDNILDVCKLLLDLIEKRTFVELVYKNFKSVIDLLSCQFESNFVKVEDKVTAQIVALANSASWFNAFYFFKLFKQANIKYQFCVPKSVLNFCNMINAQQYEPIANPWYDRDEGKWQGLIEIYAACEECGELFMENIPQISIDDEIQLIIEAVANIFEKVTNIFKANLVVNCLKKLVQKKKIQGISSFVSEDLQLEHETHDTCFSFLVIIQTFAIVINKNSRDAASISVFVKILHQFRIFAKENKNPQITVFLSLYFFEQLVYAITILDVEIISHLELMLVDLLLLILNCLKQFTDKTAVSKLLLKCEQILTMMNRDHKMINEIFLNETKSLTL